VKLTTRRRPTHLHCQSTCLRVLFAGSDTRTEKKD